MKIFIVEDGRALNHGIALSLKKEEILQAFSLSQRWLFTYRFTFLPLFCIIPILVISSWVLYPDACISLKRKPGLDTPYACMGVVHSGILIPEGYAEIGGEAKYCGEDTGGLACIAGFFKTPENGVLENLLHL